MAKKNLYLQAYKILERVTPLKMDCGNLCNKACCRGTDPESGMYLYPGEEEAQKEAGFLTVNPVRLWEVPVLLAICNGECDRKKRPLACRVFPLIPYHQTSKDLLTIIMDPRAVYICPLARTLKRHELNRQFTTKVRQAFQLLITDCEIKEFIIRQSRLLDEFTAIAARFR